MPKDEIIDLEVKADGSYGPTGEVTEVPRSRERKGRKMRKRKTTSPPIDFLEGVETGVRTLLRTKRLFEKLLNGR